MSSMTLWSQPNLGATCLAVMAQVCGETTPPAACQHA